MQHLKFKMLLRALKQSNDEPINHLPMYRTKLEKRNSLTYFWRVYRCGSPHLPQLPQVCTTPFLFTSQCWIIFYFRNMCDICGDFGGNVSCSIIDLYEVTKFVISLFLQKSLCPIYQLLEFFQGLFCWISGLQKSLFSKMRA